MSMFVEEFIEEEVEPEGLPTRSIHRTEPKWITVAPDGRTWGAMLGGMRDDRLEAKRERAVADEPIVILQPGIELDAAEMAQMKGAIGSVIRRVLARDWQVRVGVSIAQMPAVRFVDAGDDHEAGDVRYQPYVATVYEVLASINWKGQVVGFHATWTQKDSGSVSFQGARTTDPLFGEAWRPTASKPRKPREWERAEAVDPPDGFTPWLKMFAATDAEIKQKQRSKEDA